VVLLLALYHESEDVSDAHWKLELSVAWDVGTGVDVSVVVTLLLALIESVAEGTGETGSVSIEVVLDAWGEVTVPDETSVIFGNADSTLVVLEISDVLDWLT
jgi:hypothetical protein